MSATVLKQVALEEIRANPVALREVQRDDDQYANLSADVGKRGILLPITVREKTDETGEVYYEIVDGLHRYSAACDNDLPEVPVSVLDLSDAEIIETQIVANLCRVDTKPVEYTKALRRMMDLNPTMTVRELADRISQSPTFVMQRLSLLKLDDSVQKLVDTDDINLSNAYALAKLPKDEQHSWTDQAMTQSPTEFVPAINKRVKELRDAAREGRVASEKTFEAPVRARKMGELKSELQNPEFGPALVAEFGCTTAAEGFALGIQWALHQDPHSVTAARAKWEQTEKARETEKRKRAAEREAKRAREAAAKAEAAQEAAGLTDDELEAAIAQAETDDV